ncbi:MAG: hypothetical protein ACNFW9_00365 [Candidatus Kerfeldbacteria bacterium]
MSRKIAHKNIQASWSGLVLLVVVAMLIGIYFLRIDSSYDLVPYNIDPNLVVYKTNVAIAAEETIKKVEYKDDNYNFKTNYSEDWKSENEITGEGENVISSVTFTKGIESVSISVMAQSMEGVVKNSINIDKETNIKVNSQDAVRIDGGSSKDGSDITMILLKNNDNLYVFQGIGQEFEDIVRYFEIY